MRSNDGEGLWTPRTFILFLALVVAFVQAGLYAGHWSSIDNFPQDVLLREQDGARTRALGHVAEHPISVLMDNAEKRFRNLLSKQSKTLKAAVAEYKKRYGRNPPKGFDKWWEFAQAHGVKMIDEYDGLVEDLAPFWEMTGAFFRKRAVEAAQVLPSVDLVRIRDGIADVVNFGGEEVGMRARGFLKMIQKFKHTLPDMDFAINARSEGRVLIPWEHRRFPNITTLDASYATSLSETLPLPDWRGQGNTWDAYRRTCSPDSPARRLLSAVRTSPLNGSTAYFQTPTSRLGSEFKFARDIDGKYSFCDNPWARNNQGHFFSDWRTVPVPFPILSPAKSSGYADIRIPSHYYHGTTRRYTYAWDEVNLEPKEMDSMETSWENKDEKIFFRGATTGGGSSPPGFSSQYQRHRFVRMASEPSGQNHTLVFTDPPSSSNYVYAKVPTNALNAAIMDVAFVSSVDHRHYPGGLQQEMEDHRFDDAVLLREYWAHKYLLDLDGMSYSGKFFAFLASDSAVVKSSVYSEFFSDWIQPWLHYIPLTSTYREIYNIHAFFSGAPDAALQATNSTALVLPADQRRSLDGDLRLRRIARAGKQWRKTIGRPIDMEAYVYRLCLEYARLWADDREAMSYP